MGISYFKSLMKKSFFFYRFFFSSSILISRRSYGVTFQAGHGDSSNGNDGLPISSTEPYHESYDSLTT